MMPAYRDQNTMSKFTSLTTAAALLSTLALPALATTPQAGVHHRAVKHPIHRIAATTDTAVKPATPATPAMAAPVTTAAKPAATIPAPAAAKPTPAKPN